MEFQVGLANGQVHEFTGDARYEIEQSGVISINDGAGRRIRFSPTGWLVVEHELPTSAF